MEFRNDPINSKRHIVTVDNEAEHARLVTDAIPRGLIGGEWLVWKLQRDFLDTTEYPHDINVTVRQFYRISVRALRRQLSEE